MSNKIKEDVAIKNCTLQSVHELEGLNFFIPSYQRGYRWDEKQITHLLDDLYDYNNRVNDRSDNRGDICKFYCLQPLVVKEKKENNKIVGYEVIDGQQRLTTLYLILCYLKDYLKESNIDFGFFSLDYETRKNCKLFFQEEKFKTVNNENIDFLYISQGYDCIENWFKDSPVKRKQGITNVLVSEKDKNGMLNKKFLAQFIWYQVDDNEDPYGVFSRLNSGKISLSDAELTKAMILNEHNQKCGNEEFNQNTISNEWNEIENSLHDDLFWNFVNPNPSGYIATRIDFILEIATRCKEKESFEKLKENEVYPVFSYFYKKIENSNTMWYEAWNEIRSVFRTMKTWYANRELYHYIGYLINQKGKSDQSKYNLLCGVKNSESEDSDDELQKLNNIGLFKYYETHDKKKFLDMVKTACKKTLFDKTNVPLKMNELFYNNPGDKGTIHNVLLLFNLATVQNQVSEISRYPFNLHHQATIESKWSLEHIHAQNERQKRKWTPEEIENLKEIIKTMPADSDSEQQELRLELIDYLSDETMNGESTWEKTNKAVAGLFMSAKIKTIGDETDGKYTSDFSEDHSLMNMALLQGDKNAAFSNKLFFEKRKKLSEYEDAETTTSFVPVCTRNVFFKHYSPNSLNPYMWDKEAGKEYVVAIVKTVSRYISAKPYYPDDKKVPMGSFEYGLWWDEETKQQNEDKTE